MRELAGAPLLGTPEPADPGFPCIAAEDVRLLAWQRCGIIRSGRELEETCDRLGRVPIQAAPRPNRALFELRSMHAVVSLIARSALARQESRGAHYRTDFPEKRAEFHKHSVVTKDHDVTFR
jgi:L-aspartate oxidase